MPTESCSKMSKVQSLTSYPEFKLFNKTTTPQCTLQSSAATGVLTLYRISPIKLIQLLMASKNLSSESKDSQPPPMLKVESKYYFFICAYFWCEGDYFIQMIKALPFSMKCNDHFSCKYYYHFSNLPLLPVIYFLQKCCLCEKPGHWKMQTVSHYLNHVPLSQLEAWYHRCANASSMWRELNFEIYALHFL